MHKTKNIEWDLLYTPTLSDRVKLEIHHTPTKKKIQSHRRHKDSKFKTEKPRQSHESKDPKESQGQLPPKPFDGAPNPKSQIPNEEFSNGQPGRQ